MPRRDLRLPTPLTSSSPLRPGAPGRARATGLAIAAFALTLALCPVARAADPARGAMLFATPPAPGLLGCADCHSDNPVVNNFGNIWAGRNAVALIERAILSNTGGMGYLRNYRSADDLADIAAYLGNSPGALDFPATPVGARSTLRTVTVATSTKTGAGAFSATTEGDFAIVASDCSPERPRFSACSIDLVFTPGAAGVRRGALVMMHDATPTPVRVSLAGVAPDRPPAVASVSPSTIDFGGSPVGLPGRARNATLSNQSGETLTVTGLSADAGFAIVGGSCSVGTVLARGERCTVALRHEAAAAGALTGRLWLGHDGAGGGSAVGLAGRGEPAAARLQADVDGLDFGIRPVDAAPAVAAVRLLNAGTADVAALEVDAGGAGFSVDVSRCQAALPLRTGQGCVLQVEMALPRPGPFSATLRVAGGGATLELPLQGQGVGAQAPAPPQSNQHRLLFDTVVGGTERQAITLFQGGSAALPLAALRIEGPDAADFALEPGPGCGTSLEANARCSVGLRFTPRAARPHRASLRVADAAGLLQPLIVPLAGLGHPAAAPRASTDAVALRFAAAAPGVAISQGLTVRNPGPLGWRWARLRIAGDHAMGFSLSGDCAEVALLPAQATCQLAVRYTADGSGTSAATLQLVPEGGTALLVSLSAGGATAPSKVAPLLAGPTAALVVLPETVVFQAGPAASSSAAPVQTVRWRNDGNAVARIEGFDLQAPGFALVPGSPGTDACPPPPFDLLPAEACSLLLRWDGTSAGAAGGRLTAAADDPWGGAGVAVMVREDPAQRSNIGSGGGAAGPIGWWLALLVAAALLANTEARDRRRPAHRAGSRTGNP